MSLKEYALQYLLESSWALSFIRYDERSDEFKQSCYELWASKKLANELLHLEPGADVMTYVQSFAKRMNDYACVDNESLRFSVAYDVATDVLDCLCAMFE